MPPAKNFVYNKMFAFLLKNLFFAFLEVPDTNSKEILWEKKNKKTKKKNKTKLSLILDENANRQEFCSK